MSGFAKAPNAKGLKARFYQAQDAGLDLLRPDKLKSGVVHGTFTILNTNGEKLVLGLIPSTGEFGIAMYDSDGNLIKKFVGPTIFTFNPSDDDHNVMQDGKLPDGSYGWAVAKEEHDVEDAF